MIRCIGLYLDYLSDMRLLSILERATERAIDEHTIVVRRGLWD